MTRPLITAQTAAQIAILIALGFTLTVQLAFADTGKTRAQVRAELAEAVRLGLVPTTEDSSLPRDLNPSAYPPLPEPMGKTDTRKDCRACASK